MKLCRWCEQEKRLTDFYPHPRMSDDRLNKCKDCVIAYERTRRETVPAVQAAERARYRNGKKTESLVKYRTEHAERNAMAKRASGIVLRAVRTGKIRKPDACQRCSAKDVFLEGAHHDYSKPMEVQWLCRRCHRRWDSEHPKTLASA